MKRLHGCLAVALVALIAVLSLSAAPPPTPAPALPIGTVIESLSCQGSADQRYALYLPTSYRPDRAWPILYALDARANGAEVAEIFKAGAERFGWIVASSYNSQSDLSTDPNPAALRAMWADTHARLNLDDRRIYVAGYSGTVRAAIRLALIAPGSITGIFAASAGFPFERPPAKDDPFDFFGTTGTRDFNYYEMLKLDAKLDALALPHRIELFDGGHDWPPPALAARGIGWLELRAMQRRLRPIDAGLVDGLWAEDLEQARSAEAAGRQAEAFHTWSAMRTSYAGLRDTAEAERKAAELGASAAVQREIEQRDGRMRRDRAFLAEAQRVFTRALATLDDPEAPPPTGSRIAAELKLKDWKQRAESTDVEESLSAQRMLNTLAGQTGFYQPTQFIERKEWDKAILMLSVAAEISPDSSSLQVSIAKTYASKGKVGKKRALEALEKAVALGWADRAWIDAEPAFDALRQDPRFREIVGKIPERGRG